MKKIYIAPVVNNTYKSGVQNVVYNALVRSLASYKVVQVVSSPADADAVLNIRVNQADSVASSTAAASNLNHPVSQSVPSNIGSLGIATEYNATLGCTFTLIKRNPRPGQKAQLWAADFSRSRPFPGSNQLGSLGTTSPLINDSEFDRTLLDIAQNMMLDVREQMVERF